MFDRVGEIYKITRLSCFLRALRKFFEISFQKFKIPKKQTFDVSHCFLQFAYRKMNKSENLDSIREQRKS